ncbi:MAG: hypothetical protein KGH96_22020 [Sphingomonadales bacterium]|nr:hypothetical protein [Sphingomonadales bacterium]
MCQDLYFAPVDKGARLGNRHEPLANFCRDIAAAGATGEFKPELTLGCCIAGRQVEYKFSQAFGAKRCQILGVEGLFRSHARSFARHLAAVKCLTTLIETASCRLRLFEELITCEQPMKSCPISEGSPARTDAHHHKLLPNFTSTLRIRFLQIRQNSRIPSGFNAFHGQADRRVHRQVHKPPENPAQSQRCSSRDGIALPQADM